VSRSKDAFLQVVERMLARFFLTGFSQVRPGRDLPHEGISRRSGPWRGAGQQFPEMAGRTPGEAATDGHVGASG
jgi:hypothetical protein